MAGSERRAAERDYGFVRVRFGLH